MVISNKTIAILAILVIIISVVSTYIVIEKANNVPVIRSSQGQIGVYVVNPSPSGQIGVNVVSPEEEARTEGEE